MPVPSIVIDGSQPYGVSFTATIGGKGPFIVESFTANRPRTIAEDRTQTGAPQRWRATEDFITASGVVQAPTGTANWPQAGDPMGPITIDDNYGAETWCVIEVPTEQTNDPSAIRKINITFRKVINSITTA